MKRKTLVQRARAWAERHGWFVEIHAKNGAANAWLAGYRAARADARKEAKRG